MQVADAVFWGHSVRYTFRVRTPRKPMFSLLAHPLFRGLWASLGSHHWLQMSEKLSVFRNASIRPCDGLMTSQGLTGRVCAIKRSVSTTTANFHALIKSVRCAKISNTEIHITRLSVVGREDRGSRSKRRPNRSRERIPTNFQPYPGNSDSSAGCQCCPVYLQR